MSFLYFKALHIIFVVTWFAGLFYIVRLFIYHQEAKLLAEPDRSILTKQYKVMEKRLWYGITWPSCILAITFGGFLLSDFLPLKGQAWLQAKLTFVFFLLLYHLKCGAIFQKLQNDRCQLKSGTLRVWNEVATLFLFAIVFLVVLKDMTSFLYGFLGLVFLSGMLFIAIKIYKAKRSDS